MKVLRLVTTAVAVSLGAKATPRSTHTQQVQHIRRKAGGSGLTAGVKSCCRLSKRLRFKKCQIRADNIYCNPRYALDCRQIVPLYVTLSFVYCLVFVSVCLFWLFA
uniref:Uncharacterized protein n=1 Tax=Rhipicephalus appendiculatus TaxID=34631 RepID=A0A131YDT3_RHIAP